ncbi:hypothetical protein [Halorubrum laminariae]|uniref:DUF8135 domain-containing protein n=1 Tax=Halorubrum laminariae TaxID=1433523 RepID=A0ABD6BXU5_9EURY|nr:hypothetical protein [Halorubrum laminariae]
MTDDETDGADGRTTGDADGGPVGDADVEAIDPFDELGPAGDVDADDIDDFGDIDDPDDPFERMDVGDLGDEDIWQSLDVDAGELGGSGPDSAAVADASTRGSASDATLGAGDAGSEHADRTVDKRAYCQQCPHFTAPPEADCTHEGTEIVEVVDVDEFRVRNCPLVAKADRAAESARDM